MRDDLDWETCTGVVRGHDTDFMRFWKILNGVLAVRQQPEMRYGEARSCWDEMWEEHKR
jgi:hypothetical protein